MAADELFATCRHQWVWRKKAGGWTRRSLPPTPEPQSWLRFPFRYLPKSRCDRSTPRRSSGASVPTVPPVTYRPRPVPFAPNHSHCSCSVTRTGATRPRSGPVPDQPRRKAAPTTVLPGQRGPPRCTTSRRRSCWAPIKQPSTLRAGGIHPAHLPPRYAVPCLVRMMPLTSGDAPQEVVPAGENLGRMKAVGERLGRIDRVNRRHHESPGNEQTRRSARPIGPSAQVSAPRARTSRRSPRPCRPCGPYALVRLLPRGRRRGSGRP